MNLILNRSILFFTGVLIFILPIGHTISIRNISMLFLILIVGYLFFTKNISGFNKICNHEIKYITIILSLFTFWLFIVAFFISKETLWSLGEIKKEWLVPLVYFITFSLISMHSLTQNKEFQKNFYTVIVLMFFIHVLYFDLFALKYYIDTKSILSRFAGLTEGPDKSNYLTIILLAFLVSEVIFRFRTSKKILNINNFLLSLIIGLTLMSSVFEGMRNGAIAIIFLAISGIFLSFYNNEKYTKKFKIFISCFIFIILTFPTVYNITHDKRWSTLIQTIPIALDTTHHKAWLYHKINSSYPYPKLPNGKTVNPSNYERVAWAYEGSKLILEHPLGIGFGRNAFGHGIKEKYKVSKQIGHSHSGLIDLTIGVGIPGLIIWLSFGLYLIYLSYSIFIKYHSFFALVLFFNTSGFFSRFVVDSNMRDHMFETFMLIIGSSLIFMLKDKYDAENN